MENNVEKNNMLKEFYIPTYIFIPESPVEHASLIPTCPVVVFINTKSGGQLGRELIVTYRKLLNDAQVFDLLDEAPDKVLHRLYSNLERLKHGGDTLASEVYRRLIRLIVAGGDGMAGWLLGVVSDLKLVRPPPVATVPLGTGNNLPYSFGWVSLKIKTILFFLLDNLYCSTATEPTAQNASNEQEMAAPGPNTSNDQEMAPPAPFASNEQELAAPAPNALSSPTRLTRDQIIENSPIRVTRGRLQTLRGEGVDPIIAASPDKTVQKRSPPKKLKPRRLKTN